MISLKLAYRNILGSGIRTILNIIVLSFAFVVFMIYFGMMEGWSLQALHDIKSWEIGKGQYWANNYDKTDYFTIQDAHKPITKQMHTEIDKGNATAVLYREASVFPQGRLQSAIIKGVDKNQDFLAIKHSFEKLKNQDNKYSIIMGRQMAKGLGLEIGDNLLIRWRDINGTFDATSFTLVDIFSTTSSQTDAGFIYMDLSLLQELTSMQNRCTLVTLNNKDIRFDTQDFVYKDVETLTADLQLMINAGKLEGFIVYMMILLVGLLAIFDTQVLAIYRRTKEIGTYLALGMTRKQVVRIFTIEGTAYSILSLGFAAIWGTPIFIYLNKVGINLNGIFNVEDMGVNMSGIIKCYYRLDAILFGVLFLIISSMIVSYLPAKKIAKINPTLAIKGKI